jgi:hypothetical protein
MSNANDSSATIENWEHHFWGEVGKGYGVLSNKVDLSATSMRELSEYFAAR